MNERDDELREQAWTLISNEERTQGELYETRERWKKCDQKFADLIRADERGVCLKIAESQRKNVEILTSFPPQSAAARNIEAMIYERGNT